MKKVKDILICFYHSAIPNEYFYPKLVRVHFVNSLRYLLALVGITIIGFLFITFAKFNPFVINEMKSSIFTAFNTYPPNSVIRIYNKSLYSIDKKPVYIWLDLFRKKHLFLVVDPSIQKSTIRSFPAFVIFGSENLYVQANKKIYSLPYSIDFSLTKTDFDHFITLIDTFYVPFVFMIYILLIVGIPIFFFLWIGLSLSMSSLFLYLVSMFTSKKISFHKIFQIGIHSSSIPIFIGFLFYIFLPLHRSIPMMTFILFIIFQAVSIYEVYYANLPRKTYQHIKKHPIHLKRSL